ncbi:hypothetical protein NDU88_004060 [Pleurodeles waltl]|uniref:Uncharacterized protein n=1 Tax=Pleurodeles waltl TaxID=8319 RepID=A0AAV7PE13_PLEWA|nr:hypothetical protein NDU88_004060 [Pleurodeles waltl]
MLWRLGSLLALNNVLDPMGHSSAVVSAKEHPTSSGERSNPFEILRIWREQQEGPNGTRRESPLLHLKVHTKACGSEGTNLPGTQPSLQLDNLSDID